MTTPNRPTPWALTPTDLTRLWAADAGNLADGELADELADKICPMWETRHWLDGAGGRYVEILAPTDGAAAALRVEITPESGARTFRMGREENDIRTFRPGRPAAADMVEHVRHLLFNRLTARIGSERMGILAMSGSFSALQHRLYGTAERLVTETTLPSPAGDEPLDWPGCPEAGEAGDAGRALDMVYALLTGRNDRAREFWNGNHHSQRTALAPEPWRESNQQADELNDELIERAIELAKEITPWWTPIRQRTEPESGNNVTEVMFNEANSPAFRIELMTDGTVVIDPPGHHKANFNFNTTEPADRARRQVEGIIMGQLLALHPNPAATVADTANEGVTVTHATDIMDPDAPFTNRGNHRERIKRGARRVLNQRLEPADLPGRRRSTEITEHNLGALTTRVVRKTLSRPHAAKFPGAYAKKTGGGQNTVHYNVIAANGPILDRIPHSGRAAVNYFQQVMVPLYTQLIRFQHPGQIIRAVRRHIDLEDSGWRWFLLTGDHIGWNDDHEENRAQARLQAQLLQQANRPEADERRVGEVVRCLRTSRAIRFAPLESDEPWRNWVRAVNLYLGRPVGPTVQDTADLVHVGDAITQQVVRYEAPAWPAETWEQMVERANQVVQRNNRDRAPLNRLAWNSALGVTQVEDFQFVPVTSSGELAHWGARMKNCVAVYDTVCADRGDRIFIAHNQQGEPIGTVQIGQEGADWQVRQLEGKNRTAANGPLELAATGLARQYGAAVREERRSRRSAAPTTGTKGANP